MLRLHPSTIVLTHEEVNRVLEQPCPPSSTSQSASSLRWDYGNPIRHQKPPIGAASDDLSTRTQGLSLVSQDDAGYTAGTEGEDDEFYTAGSIADDGVTASNLDGLEDARVEAWMSDEGLVREIEQWSIWQDPDEYSDGQDTEYLADGEQFSDDERTPHHRPRFQMATRQLDGVGELDYGIMVEMETARVNAIPRRLAVLTGSRRNTSPVSQQDGAPQDVLTDNLHRTVSRSSLGEPIDRDQRDPHALLMDSVTIGRVPHGRFRFMDARHRGSLRIPGNSSLEDSTDDSWQAQIEPLGDTDERKERMQIEAAKRIIR